MNNNLKIDEKKLARQKEGVHKFFNSSKYGSYKDCVGCLNYFTGVGKTFTAILIIKRYKEISENTNIVIVCPAHLVSQWKKELLKHFYNKDLKYIRVFSPEYILNNNIILNPRLLIVDELDAFYSEKRLKLLDKTQIRYIDFLGLTATYEDINNRHLKVKDLCPIIDKISEQEALKNNYISNFIEYNLGLEFSREEQEVHDDLSKKIREGLSKFGKGSFDLAKKCLRGGKLKDGTEISSTLACQMWASDMGWHTKLNLNNPTDREINDLWNPKVVFAYANNLFRNIRKRKELIYNNSIKLSTACKILEKFEFTKTVVFSQSTEFANVLYGVVNQKMPDNAVVYHSQIETQMFPSIKTGVMIKHGKKRLKDRALHRLNNNLSNHLITSSVLDKGLDIPSLVLGVTTSGTQNPTQHKQRGGRVKRINSENKEAVSILVNLYMKDSTETRWLKTRQSLSNNIIYWIDDINEISYKPNLKTNKLNDTDI